jgi:hypothetical protein
LLQLGRALAVAATGAAVRCAAAAAVKSRQGMFIPAIVGSVAYVALAIMRLVSVEVVEGLSSVWRKRSMITMTRIVAVVDVAIKAVGSMKPGAGSNKDPAHSHMECSRSTRRGTPAPLQC